jgi:hypothetical protein
MKKYCLLSLCLGLFWVASPVMGDTMLFYDDNSLETALEILLSNLEQEIPKEYSDFPVIWKHLPLPVDKSVTPKGSCYSRSSPQPNKIKYLLLPSLAGLDQEDVTQGAHKIAGQCFGQERKECFIRITHSYGDGAAGFEIRFKTIDNKIITDSMFCDITP